MEHKYTFTPLTFNRNNNEHFTSLLDALLEVKPITPWEDIKVGDVYHIPNILLYKRADFIVYIRHSEYMTGIIMEYDTMKWKNHTIYRNEVRAKFLTKKLRIGNG